MSFDDPRLAVVYDIDNPDGPDHDFYRRLADERSAVHVTDLGCGTGILTVTLARPGREVIGIDPAPAMLDRARNRPGGEQVSWCLGTSEHIAQASADLVLMTGNVAMHIIGDEWHETLDRIAQGLRPGGVLAFESRNPEAEAWRQWNHAPVERETPVGVLCESLATDPPDPRGVVVMHCHNRFVDDGSVVEVDMPLQFRSHTQLVDDLARAGLRVEATHRDWDGHPFTGGAEQPLMVAVAVRL